MTDNKRGPSKRVLEPFDRVSEVLFGLIMVLTFTGSLSVATAGGNDVRTMLIGALGCNLAWGIVDGAFYLMGALADKGTSLSALRALQKTSDPASARQIIADELPPVIASVMRDDEFENIRRRLNDLPQPPQRSRIAKEDWRGAMGVFLLVFLSTFPVTIPFMLVDHVALAMRLSNSVAIVMLFGTGYAYGRIVGQHPAQMGLLMVAVGVLLVALTIALGG